MLFNSNTFLFLFLPVVFFGFFKIGKHNRLLGALWLFLASLFFYGWWNPVYVLLLLASIVFNYGIGVFLSRDYDSGHALRAKWILRLGIVADLSLLGYFKYANFFVNNLDSILNFDWQLETIVLPLGISFFTFTQIAFLVDAYRGEVKEANFVHYGLFVTYFPHLIAGPVLHHKEMMPQFENPTIYKLNWENLSVGLTIYAIGLFKKVVLADGVAPFANSVFDIAAGGGNLTFVEAWGGALAYTFQLYFDFSGYSDMAIGISRLFGVKLPLNFDSPYKSVNIIEFWRRWHMTLSRFLRDYLYIALGGNRNGKTRRYINLLLTMLLGGLWHGAGWTFVIWGGLHGLYLIINHGWHQIRRSLGHDIKTISRQGRLAAMTLTFMAVVFAWVFFRAQNIDAALSMLSGMAGMNGLLLPEDLLPQYLAKQLVDCGVGFGRLPAFSVVLGGTNAMVMWVATLWAVVWLTPNSQQIMAAFKPALETVTSTSRIVWQPNIIWMVVTVFAFL
jgi:D-alanyl-lipoteichoic acid acyltransferase DltB (MBOAT superfamily)